MLRFLNPLMYNYVTAINKRFLVATAGVIANNHCCSSSYDSSCCVPNMTAKVMTKDMAAMT